MLSSRTTWPIHCSSSVCLAKETARLQEIGLSSSSRCSEHSLKILAHILVFKPIRKELCLNPELKNYTYCPMFLSLYELESTPTTCMHFQSKMSQVCSESFFESTVHLLLAKYQPTS
ncbi:hypothetical protein VP01_1483g6 [Puccinia sorghi]|uniref:Uncharacterized protein n=1 Tax=Puccinia sorghi TaxID=27349 RepID=A0A0L6VJG3_9BASI|nr:hypothetical protein VP01_1483g6 [Puccinia sorghi]